MESNRRKRNWRRVGWGALIVLAVLIITAAIALWLGPPRDPKSFALDDEDFGLGFRVGDPWDPDAFKAAIEDKGVEVECGEAFTSGLNTGQQAVLFAVDDGLIYFRLASSASGTDTMLESIDITHNIRFSGADGSYSYHLLSATERAHRALAGSDCAVLGSSEEEVVGLYGTPLISLFLLPTKGRTTYLGSRQCVSFEYLDHAVNFMRVSIGYDSSIAHRLQHWRNYMLAPAKQRDLQEIILELDDQPYVNTQRR